VGTPRSSSSVLQQNRELVSKVEGLVGGGIGGERRREKEERGERRRGN
jgi:hypothetical protein